MKTLCQSTAALAEGADNVRIQKRVSRVSLSAPKIKPKKKMKKHKWKARTRKNFLEPLVFDCSRCGQSFIPNLLSVYEVNWHPPDYGCIPALKGIVYAHR